VSEVVNNTDEQHYCQICFFVRWHWPRFDYIYLNSKSYRDCDVFNAHSVNEDSHENLGIKGFRFVAKFKKLEIRL